MPVSPEQVRKALADLLADPEAFKSILPTMASVFPVQGGACGSQTSGQIAKFCDGSGTVDDSVITESSSKIGIGTTSPATKLHVLDDAAANDETTAEVTVGAGADATLGPLNLLIKHHPSATGGNRFVDISAADNVALRNLVLQGAGGGNVGIGTTSPDSPLHVKVTTTTDPVIKVQSPNQGDGLSIKVTHPNAVIGFALAGGNGHFVSSAIQDDACVFGQQGKNLLFALGQFEKMRIASSGNIGIGTASPSALLHAAGSQPDSVAGNGNAATQVLQITGGKGGDTSGSSGQTAGPGADAKVTAGDGGDAGSGSTNGNGGSIFLKPGAAGSGGGTAGKAGSVIIGAGSASKQVNGGPELISAQHASDQDKVVLWCGLTTDVDARFLFSYRGLLEWSPGGASGDTDQDIALFRPVGSAGAGELWIQSLNSKSSTDAFRVNKATSGADGEPVLRVDTTNSRVAVNNADGSATLDVKGTSGITGMRVLHTSSSEIAMGAGVIGDSNLRFIVSGAGALSWGPGGTDPADITLSRFSGGNPSTKGLALTGGDLQILDAGKGIILKSPDGTKCVRISVDNSGNLQTTTFTTCP